MTSEKFVSHFKKERDSYLQDIFETEETSAGTVREQLVKKLGSDKELRTFVETILTDTYYTMLLGLDGSASIGGEQHTFKILDEDSNVVSECGDIEAAAYEAFHGEDN